MEDSRYDLNAFWSDHKIVLPIHYLVYLGDCGSKRASSASVETVYSGATKLADEATHMSDDVLAAYIFLHYNWAFDFLRPAMAKQWLTSYENMRRRTAATRLLHSTIVIQSTSLRMAKIPPLTQQMTLSPSYSNQCLPSILIPSALH